MTTQAVVQPASRGGLRKRAVGRSAARSACGAHRVVPMARYRAVRGAALAAAIIWLLAAPASAQSGKKAGADTFEVSVRAIRATKSDSEVSPELRPIVRQLQSQFKYTGFKVIAQRSGRVEAGKTFAADLGDGFRTKLTPLKREGTRVQMKVEVLERQGGEEKTRFNTTVTIDSGRYNLQGGWKLGQGDDILIVATSAR